MYRQFHTERETCTFTIKSNLLCIYIAYSYQGQF